MLATAALVPASQAGASANDAYSQAVLAAGPVAYWRLGDGGATAVDELGSNDGTLNGGVVTGRPGAISGSTDTAMRFDGVNDYIALGSSPTLQPQLFTVETWFRSLGQPNAPGYIGRWRTFGWSAVVSQRGTVSGSIYGTSGTQYVAESPGRYDDGLWHHLVVSRAAASLSLIIDGSVVATVAVPEASRYEAGAAAIGRDGNANDWYFNGDIDEFAFYSRPLTLSEAIAHYCLGGGSGAVCNHPPTASAGTSQTVPEGSTVTLDGSASSDPDGNALSYSWQLLDTTGPPVTLSGSTAPQASFAATDDGIYDFRLTVNDGFASASADTTVTVTNVAPSVALAADPGATPATAHVTVTFDDPGLLDTHTAEFDWGDGSPAEVVTAPGSGHGTVARDHVYSSSGNYAVKVRVADDDGDANSAGIPVSVTVVTTTSRHLPAASLWATSTANSDTLAVNGLDIKVSGLAHSNASTRVFGGWVRLLGGTEYAKAMHVFGWPIVITPAAAQTAPSTGDWAGIADYRPGGSGAAAAGAAFFDVSSQCSGGVWRPTTPLPAGLYYAKLCGQPDERGDDGTGVHRGRRGDQPLDATRRGAHALRRRRPTGVRLERAQRRGRVRSAGPGRRFARRTVGRDLRVGEHADLPRRPPRRPDRDPRYRAPVRRADRKLSHDSREVRWR